jgi:WD40 repeat protein
MSRFVRSSKFRHVFGTVAKKEECYDDLRVTRSAWDSNYAAASPLYFGVLYESGGGGSFIVLPYSATGKVDPKSPLISGHKSAVLDIDFNPFNDSLIASVSEDCTGKIWGIPEGGLKDTMTEPLQTLSGHKRKVGTVKFSPTANNILATASTDCSVKIWDIEKGKDLLSVDAQHTDIIQSADWNRNGSLLATSCKDKKLRIVDPRQKKIVAETEAHAGVKGSRVIYLGMDKLFSCGFSKTSEREFSIWDARNLSSKLAHQSVDSASGLLMPFYDEDTKIVFLGGKGDGNIRYYEIVDDATQVYYLSEFKSNTPQRGLCTLPKRAVSTSDCEIVKMLKVSVKMIEPISFQVPRKSDIFQDDIFPDTFAGEPALTAEEWIGGKDGEPKLMSLAGGFVKKAPVAFTPEKQEAPKELSEKEVRAEYEKLKQRVAYLEAEIIKKDSKIKELSG